MLQFNLLPDVKLEYVKTQRTKHLLTLLSLAASAAGIAILLLAALTVYGVQKKSLHDLNGDIKKYSTQLKSVPDLDKILTVQNQLGTLTTLHDQKPVTDRLFTYISQVTPAQASLNKLTIDFTANTLTIGGKTPGLEVVSTYTDTLKATKYTTDSSDSKKTNAFSSVVLTSFSRGDEGATFTITCNFDPAIFNSANKVTLTVPSSAASDQSSVFDGGGN
jgi:Tfp pilus assembly protein PilN